MKIRLNLTIVLGAIALLLALISWIHPAGGRPRISPGIVVVILLLVGIRYAAQQQAQKRSALVKTVPEHPLGLAEDPSSQSPLPGGGSREASAADPAGSSNPKELSGRRGGSPDVPDRT